ncbi:hypothetical protein amb1908 [Paramagnetospirillum magneticum AMB-1]|uniref:Uncharacterized protein n=1 Tax=Paramagnetospirillum magneticum (strain ATCC 700264 / AMB-1) TaxID=342108 RepID=Q2W613_PARM1|nr:hypothetical protein amb1908 [Paramagnetospirillum magneticum AMB-1]
MHGCLRHMRSQARTSRCSTPNMDRLAAMNRNSTMTGLRSEGGID